MMSEKQKFSLKARARSFVYAYQGIVYCLKTQHNAWIHLFLTALVVFCGFFFQINLYEWFILMLCIGFVLTAEIFNTAIEELVNLISPEYHEKGWTCERLGFGGCFDCSYCCGRYWIDDIFAEGLGLGKSRFCIKFLLLSQLHKHQ